MRAVLLVLVTAFTVFASATTPALAQSHGWITSADAVDALTQERIETVKAALTQASGTPSVDAINTISQALSNTESRLKQVMQLKAKRDDGQLSNEKFAQLAGIANKGLNEQLKSATQGLQTLNKVAGFSHPAAITLTTLVDKYNKAKIQVTEIIKQ